MAAHAAIGQTRKYTGEPYIAHPERVASLVASVTSNEAAIAAAYLHDVVEDTKVSLAVVREEFGDAVARFVEELTDVSKPEDGNREARKAIDRAHTAKASATAKTIKLADLIDNSRNIVAHDPDFARVYMPEKRLLLGVLYEGSPVLWHKANDIVTQYFSERQ
ncbi:HD domain-containing protein [Burkholderia contaminans]|uniref:HD domain-containing protein n=1 Tax=Burkholderia TaxID=32008 RepID=UPI002017BFC0|nr:MULTISPECIES: HD domain-containing protein [Burkholderia]UXZ68665.1 HD domain-containing protein [Burkholderia contaminans]UXZ76426.1 HD domain-containing protein [Burkholderia contaminans]